MTMIEVIEQTRRKLEGTGILPRWIKFSQKAHDALLAEINKRDGRKHFKIFEIMGMRVEIDNECPPGGAYMGGDG